MLLILWLKPIIVGNKVHQSNPIALNKREQQMVEERLTILLILCLWVDYDCVFSLVYIKETSLSEEFYSDVKVVLSFQSFSNNEIIAN